MIVNTIWVILGDSARSKSTIWVYTNDGKLTLGTLDEAGKRLEHCGCDERR